MTACWLSFFIICSFWYGTINFDHNNIDKAYDVLEEYVKRGIKDKLKEEFKELD
jgi:hypothetical protein